MSQLAAERPRITTAGKPHIPLRVFYWAQMTATQPFNTGIQRVTRALGRALVRAGVEVIPVKWNPDIDSISLLDPSEAATLAAYGGPPSSELTSLPISLKGEWLLHPEITVPVVSPNLSVPALAHSLGMRVASIFYDLIPGKMTEIYPCSVADAFAPYWAGFASADVILPISWTVTGDLRRYLSGRGLPVPRIVPCALAGELPDVPRQREARTRHAQGQPMRLVAIGTWEPRKNYLRLLHALKDARTLCAGHRIELTIIGRGAGFTDLDAELESLAAEIGGVIYYRSFTDQELARTIDNSDASVYASWEEGFGLPVLESLWRGLPVPLS